MGNVLRGVWYLIRDNKALLVLCAILIVGAKLTGTWWVNKDIEKNHPYYYHDKIASPTWPEAVNLENAIWRDPADNAIEVAAYNKGVAEADCESSAGGYEGIDRPTMRVIFRNGSIRSSSIACPQFGFAVSLDITDKDHIVFMLIETDAMNHVLDANFDGYRQELIGDLQSFNSTLDQEAAYKTAWLGGKQNAQ